MEDKLNGSSSELQELDGLPGGQPSEHGQQLQKSLIRSNFERASGSYDEAALLQREVADRMLEQFEYTNITPERILDVGTGTGYCARGLESRFNKSSVIALDLAQSMLGEARRQAESKSRWFQKLKPGSSSHHFLCADTMQLPLADQSIDLIFSNFTLQWCQDLQALFHEFRRVLRPGGLLTFSTLGTDTLTELRQSWAEVDGQIHVNHFVDLHDVGDLLLYSGFEEPVTSVDRFELTYPDVMALMRDLKGLGATNTNEGRSRGLTGKEKIRRLERAYRELQGGADRISATWEVVYGHAWIPEDGFSAGSFPEEFSLPLNKFNT